MTNFANSWTPGALNFTGNTGTITIMDDPYVTPTPTPPAPPASVNTLLFPGLPGDHYFENSEYSSAFEHKRMLLQEYNKPKRQGTGIPYWTEEDEHTLVNKLHTQWFGDPWENPSSLSGMDELDVPSLTPLPMRKRPVGSFRIEYQHLHEIKLRLLHTLIAIKGRPYYVWRVHQSAGGVFWLGMQDTDGKKWKIKYKDVPDLRSIPPMYVGQPYTGWLARYPHRVYQQGLNRNNTGIWSLDGRSLQCGLDTNHGLRMIGQRQDRKWDETLASLFQDGSISQLRLSDDIAVGRKTGQRSAQAYYCGRNLGAVQDNTVILDDEDDALQDWIEKAASAVGLELRG